jgi:outer membrane protein assembly factor BamB
VTPDVPGPRATPTIDGDRVYTISRDGQLFCFEAASGKVLWSRNLGQDPQIVMPVWGFSGSPLIIGDTLLIHANLASVALNKSTGNVRWISEKAEAGFDTPAIFEHDGKLRMATLASDRIVFADPANGQVLWTYPWKTSYKENTPDVIWSDGKLFVSTGYSQGCILLDATAQKPSIIYQNRDLRTHIASSILYQKHIYGLDEAGSTSGPLRCMEFETGRVLWTSAESGFANLTMADGKLILITQRGEVVVALASPDKYTELARAHVIGGQNWTIPVLCDGLLYVRNSAGDMVCVDLRP